MQQQLAPSWLRRATVMHESAQARTTPAQYSFAAGHAQAHQRPSRTCWHVCQHTLHAVEALQCVSVCDAHKTPKYTSAAQQVNVTHAVSHHATHGREAHKQYKTAHNSSPLTPGCNTKSICPSCTPDSEAHCSWAGEACLATQQTLRTPGHAKISPPGSPQRSLPHLPATSTAAS